MYGLSVQPKVHLCGPVVLWLYPKNKYSPPLYGEDIYYINRTLTIFYFKKLNNFVKRF